MTQDRSNRESLLFPVLVPVGALAVIVAILFLFSRILLDVSHEAATITALVVATGIMVVASVVASRKSTTGAMLSMASGVLGIAMLAGGTALLVGQATPEAEPVVLALAAPQGASVDGFSVTSLAAPAGTAFTIAFDNQETGVPHNVDIATGDPAQGGEVLVETAVVTGPATVDYAIEPLDAGSYFFFCKIHPTTMTGTLTVAEGAEPGGGGITVVAKGIAFDTDTIEVAPDTPTAITFDNQDASTPHNLAIYTDESATDALFKGEVVTGPATATYDVPGLPAGTYYFRCDIHPSNMQGAFVVGGGAPASSPPPTGSAPPPSQTPPVGGGATVSVTASNLLFDIQTLALAAGQETTIAFDNQDAGLPHNVSIYTDDSASEALFTGEMATGPTSVEYTIPPLDPGTYFFRCDAHPATMFGTVSVT